MCKMNSYVFSIESYLCRKDSKLGLKKGYKLIEKGILLRFILRFYISLAFRYCFSDSITNENENELGFIIKDI